MSYGELKLSVLECNRHLNLSFSEDHLELGLCFGGTAWFISWPAYLQLSIYLVQILIKHSANIYIVSDAIRGLHILTIADEGVD